VTRRAFEKSNSFTFFILPPFAAIRAPRADDPYISLRRTYRKHNDQNSFPRVTDQLLPVLCSGMLLIIHCQSVRVVKSKYRHFETDPVLKGVSFRFFVIPFELRIYSVHHKSGIVKAAFNPSISPQKKVKSKDLTSSPFKKLLLPL